MTLPSHLKVENGFDTPDQNHVVGLQPFDCAGLDAGIKQDKSGLFLVSNGAKRDPLGGISSDGHRDNPKRRSNRKHIIYDEYVEVNGVRYLVNTSINGIYTEIIYPMIEQYQAVKKRRNRVFVLRFDLHQKFPTQDSQHISAFRKRLFQKLRRSYKFREIGYCWVREQEKSKAQHYHCVLFLNGSLIRHPSRLLLIIKDAWERPQGAFHMPVIEKPFYFVDEPHIEQEAIYRISYMAKARGKGYRSAQAKDFSCSRLRL